MRLGDGLGNLEDDIHSLSSATRRSVEARLASAGCFDVLNKKKVVEFDCLYGIQGGSVLRKGRVWHPSEFVVYHSTTIIFLTLYLMEKYSQRSDS